jgi:hypothetical protein
MNIDLVWRVAQALTGPHRIPSDNDTAYARGIIKALEQAGLRITDAQEDER